MRLIELHPVLELAVRREARAAATHAVRASVAAAAGLVLVGLAARAGPTPTENLQLLGKGMFDLTGEIASLLILLLVPALSVGPFVRARETGMLDALLLTGCSEWQVVRAFWISSLAGVTLCLASVTPCLLVAVGVGGVELGDVVVFHATSISCAAVLSAISLLFGVASGAAAASGQALFTVGLLASLLAFAVPALQGVALTHGRTFSAFVPWLSAPEMGTLFLGLLLAVVMSGTLWQASRRLARLSRMAGPEQVYSLAIKMTPTMKSPPIRDWSAYLLDRQGGSARGLATFASFAVLAVSFIGLAPSERAVAVSWGTMAIGVLALIGQAAGAWEGTRAAALLAASDRVPDLALAGRGPREVTRCILRSALRASAWSLLGAAALLGLLQALDLAAIRPVLIAGVVVLGSWLLAVAIAARLAASARSSAPVAALLTIVLCGGGALLVSGITAAGSPWRLAHPLTLLLFVLKLGRRYDAWAGSVVLAAIGWCLGGAFVYGTFIEALRLRFREPGAYREGRA
ncbi:MAG: hypothetical protein U0166_08020 [Acidobacteriota bacterium]